MSDLERDLVSALNILNQATSRNTAAKQYAGRWFNRLYFDLSRWNAEFIAFLQTYPGFREDFTQQDLEEFGGKFNMFTDSIDSRGYFSRNFGVYERGEGDICLQINFLAARLRKDFRWLSEEEPEAYMELCMAVGKVMDAPGYVHGISSNLFHSIESLRFQILEDEGYRCVPPSDKIKPNIDEVKRAIESYIQEANSTLDTVGEEARKIGFSLLTVAEYEEALQNEGSANPNIYVIGEVAMSNEGDTYHIGQAGAAGRFARSDNNTFIQSGDKRTLSEAATEIQQLLKQLEDSNPSATEIEKITYINDETTPSFKRRVVGALQASGETAIDEFVLENKYFKVVKAAVKGWLQPSS